jgi:hypothetical protein
MVYNFSISFGAVMLRIYLTAVFIAGIPFDTAYACIAWLSWAGNLLVAYALLNRRRGSRVAREHRHMTALEGP